RRGRRVRGRVAALCCLVRDSYGDTRVHLQKPDRCGWLADSGRIFHLGTHGRTPSCLLRRGLSAAQTSSPLRTVVVVGSRTLVGTPPPRTRMCPGSPRVIIGRVRPVRDQKYMKVA